MLAADAKPLQDPTRDFAIWHLHGTALYPQSIKLGLNHYAWSIERARQLMNGAPPVLGACWLNIFLKRKLLIVGLGLEDQEVFLRWLLIQRGACRLRNTSAKALSITGWYVHCLQEAMPCAKQAFLESCGLKIVCVNCFAEVYGDVWD